MQSTLHGAFGLVCAHVSFEKDELIHTQYTTDNIITIGSNFDNVNINIGIDAILRNVDTNEIIPLKVGDVVVGTNYTGNTVFDIILPRGDWELSCDGPGDYMCFSILDNQNYRPITDKLIPFKLKSNESVLVPQDKKLFLCKGSINIEDKNYSGVNRIRFTTGNKTVTAVEDSYGFFVEI
jgi:hypothetical protein